MNTPLRVLMVTSEWPTPEHPEWVPFVVQQVKFLRLAGMEVDVFSFRGARNPFNYIQAWVQVQRRLRRKRYDLVHAQFGQSGSLVIPKRVPVVVTFHGSDLEGIVGPKGRYTFQGYLLNLLSRMVASLADEIIVVSASLARRLPRRIWRHKRYHIIPGGVDLDLFKPSSKQEARDALKLPHDCLLILFGVTCFFDNETTMGYKVSRSHKEGTTWKRRGCGGSSPRNRSLRCCRILRPVRR